MNLNIWTKRHFTKNSTVEWACPNCGKSSLVVIKDKLFDYQTAASTKMIKEEDFWEIDWIRYVFSGLLKCSNCPEYITFTGIGYPEQNGYYDYELDEFHEVYDEVFTPTFFQPTLKLFELPLNCPDSVKEEIIDSFKLFWTDLSSCANKIRTSIEILLTEEKVKRFEIIKNKRRPISLHKRILDYKNKELTELLIAIKWIGNTGSHLGELETIDILEAYKLLEYSLTKIYDNKENEILKITKEINKRKGTRKRK